jgi:succinate dehydrogenase / fumarate reductase cytochrome b subunit
VWAARAGLIAAFVLHVAFGLRLASLNKKARGAVGYQRKRTLRTSLPALSMATSGLLILSFLVFHLGQTTLGLVLPDAFSLVDDKGRHDIFKMMWTGFKLPWVVLIYVAGQALLLAHLYHGTQSLWQSIGFHHRTWTPVLRTGGRLAAALIFVANLSMPLVIFFVWGNP